MYFDTHIAANQPVSKSWSDSRVASVFITLSHIVLSSNFSCPSGLAAKQLIAKQAFLLEPLSSEHSMLPGNIRYHKSVGQRRSHSQKFSVKPWLNIEYVSYLCIGMTQKWNTYIPKLLVTYVIHVSELIDTKTRTAVTRDSEADKQKQIVKQTVKLLGQWSPRQSCIP